MTDRTLLDNFVRHRSHEAFAELVRRYAGAIYNAALRQVRDPALAEDVSQAVFIILARKAASLSSSVVLAGWIVRTTHLAARDALKTESRRRTYEQRYAAMSATITTSSQTQHDALLVQDLSAQIDRALSKLNETDRGAIVLRYLQGQSTAEVAAALNVSEDAATKRLQRALIKLRACFAPHSIVPSAAAFATAMQHLPQAPLPDSLVTTAISTALAGSATAASSVSAIASGAIKMLFWTKAKLAIASIVIVLSGATVAVQAMQRARLQAPLPASGPVASSAATQPAIPPGLVGRLLNGVSVDIVAINRFPLLDDNSWWRADGSPLQPQFDPKRFAQFRQAPRMIERGLVFRVNEKMDGSPEPASVSWSMSDFEAATRRNPDGLRVRAFGQRNTPNPVTWRIGVATGPWETQLSARGLAGTTKALDGGDKSVCRVYEAGGHARFTLDTNIGEGQQASRLLALDINGNRLEVTAVRITNDGQIQKGEFTLPVPLNMLKSIELQTRPFDQWIEFRDVCMDPAHPTHPTIVTSDETQGI